MVIHDAFRKHKILLDCGLTFVTFPIPKIALLPLFVIWFGIDEASKYALIAFGTFTPTVVATYGEVGERRSYFDTNGAELFAVLVGNR